jgi:hypothetical protein
MNVEVVVNVKPAGRSFDLVAMDGSTEYFRKNGQTSTGSDQTVTIVASQALPATVEKLSKSFSWQAVFTNPDRTVDIATTTHTVYVVYDAPSDNGNPGNLPTPKRLDFSLEDSGVEGREMVHGAVGVSIAQALQKFVGIYVFANQGDFNQPTPTPIWEYVRLRKNHENAWADCIQQAKMLAACLGQLGILAGGDCAYPSSDADCSTREIHYPTGSFLRYVTSQSNPAAHLNAFQGTAWVKDEDDIAEYYTVWFQLPPQDSLLAVLRCLRDNLGNNYRQYWSYDGSGSQRFVDENLHPRRPAANWPPVWEDPVSLP